MTKKEELVASLWIEKNGGVNFNFKDEEYILFDGAGFYIEKEIKYLPKIKLKKITKGKWKGNAEVVDIKGTKQRHEFYSCHYCFKDLDEHINYLKRMKKMLNKLGYKTNWSKGASRRSRNEQSLSKAIHLSMKGGKKL